MAETIECAWVECRLDYVCYCHGGAFVVASCNDQDDEGDNDDNDIP